MKKVDTKKVIILIVILLAIAAIFVFSRPTNCKTNEECFNVKASQCSKAIVTTQNNLDTYKYEVLSKKSNNCIVITNDYSPDFYNRSNFN